VFCRNGRTFRREDSRGKRPQGGKSPRKGLLVEGTYLLNRSGDGVEREENALGGDWRPRGGLWGGAAMERGIGVGMGGRVWKERASVYGGGRESEWGARGGGRGGRRVSRLKERRKKAEGVYRGKGGS